MAPLVRRSWAPRGQTPVLFQRARSHQKVSAVAGLVVSAARDRVQLYFRFHPGRNLRTAEAVEFLRILHRHLRGPLIVIWDRLHVHRSKRIGALLNATPGLHAEYLPPYAPELNPVEYLWSFLKLHPLANFPLFRFDEISTTARIHARALQRNEGLLRSFVDHSPLSLRLK
jgi:transposase